VYSFVQKKNRKTNAVQFNLLPSLSTSGENISFGVSGGDCKIKKEYVLVVVVVVVVVERAQSLAVRRPSNVLSFDYLVFRSCARGGFIKRERERK
jgi:hypothetical protein